MYGLIGRMVAVAGRREELLDILLSQISDMPGCRSYVIARDPAHEDGIWISEVWDSAESHKASLALPAVQATITKARPLIAGFDNRHETEPLGGVGL
ncbi:antibiotic biosynthesis monooxygenase [Ancylobacter sp. MQZ15Z-1]|uniref:Antibiotic biosynthesis monooxygenase n=1 Tax=Ancylobacter mangrovi TaxID=2972472 RepID=A0A9X2PCL5_9HYPH|nr:putative quinol monooxygenase [Ancylobacter mangrovi]MCS0493653.1 antibiotic biosynthesis monooxygenase [Ancylobacter mangrovi]